MLNDFRGLLFISIGVFGVITATAGQSDKNLTLDRPKNESLKLHYLAVSKSKLQVDTGYAVYQGRLSTSPNLTHPPVLYLGVPYAGAPTGPNRFRAAPSLDIATLKKERSQGKVIDATNYPEFCIQGTTGAGDAGGAGSEDCLKVNIYAPQSAKLGSNRECSLRDVANSRLIRACAVPVLVYIHGGGSASPFPKPL